LIEKRINEGIEDAVIELTSVFSIIPLPLEMRDKFNLEA
jgi:hypothetical protein